MIFFPLEDDETEEDRIIRRDNYIENIKKNGFWASSFEIQLTCDLYDFTINIYIYCLEGYKIFCSSKVPFNDRGSYEVNLLYESVA